MTRLLQFLCCSVLAALLCGQSAAAFQTPADGTPADSTQEAATQQAAESVPLLQRVACEVNGHSFTAQDVVKAIGAYNQDLEKLLVDQEDYRRMYFSSPRFLFEVRAFADLKRLEALGVPPVSQLQLEAEAAAWAKDRGRNLSPQGVLKSNGLEVEVRARLLARQPSSHSHQELRRHMLRSVPEFFGTLQCAWIRIPMFNGNENRALNTDEIQKVYTKLDQVAKDLTDEKISWEDAVKQNSSDPTMIKNKGAIGLVRREMTSRYEEGFLRQLFQDLGFTQPKGAFLRGPIVGEKAIYLVRVEALKVSGVVELTRVHDRVVRSLRETTLQEQIQGIRKVIDGKVLAPLLSKN
jgi:hypothetical protein